MTAPTLTSVYVDTSAPNLLHGWSKGITAELQDLDEAASLLAMASDEMLAILRLDTFDFERAITRRELTALVARLKDLSPWAYMIIVGTLQQAPDGKTIRDGKATNWSWHSIAGALLSVQEAGVPVLFAKDDLAVAPMVEMLARRNRGPERIQPLRDFLNEPGVNLLMAIPGIGEETASKLISTFRTPVMAILALCDEAYQLPDGVNASLRPAIRTVLGLDAQQVIELNETSLVLPPAPRYRDILKRLQMHYAYLEGLRRDGLDRPGFADHNAELFGILQDAQSLDLKLENELLAA